MLYNIKQILYLFANARARGFQNLMTTKLANTGILWSAKIYHPGQNNNGY
jgi:hypothetical protein